MQFFAGLFLNNLLFSFLHVFVGWMFQRHVHIIFFFVVVVVRPQKNVGCVVWQPRDYRPNTSDFVSMHFLRTGFVCTVRNLIHLARLMSVSRDTTERYNRVLVGNGSPALTPAIKSLRIISFSLNNASSLPRTYSQLMHVGFL